MSLVSSLLKHIIPALESALAANEPAAKAALLSEVKTIVLELDSWIESKLVPQIPAE